MDDAQALTAATVAAIADDRRVPVPVLVGTATEADFLRASDATTALRFTLAEMEAHQLVAVALHLESITASVPVSISPYYEPSRIVLGLLLLALRDMALQLDPDTVPAGLMPAWFKQAIKDMPTEKWMDSLEEVDAEAEP